MTPRRAYEVVVSGRVSGVVAESLAPLTITARNGGTAMLAERDSTRRCSPACCG